MSRDYPMVKIAKWKSVNKVMVPVDEYGAYLDWREVDGEYARTLTSPYGSLHFAVGFDSENWDEETERKLYGDDGLEDFKPKAPDGDWMMCFDWAELPNGKILLHATCNSDSGGFIMDTDYDVVARSKAVGRAMYMVGLASDLAFENGGWHDEEGWNQDPYYLPRSIAAYLGIEPYASMTNDQLRHGPYPEDLNKRRFH